MISQDFKWDFADFLAERPDAPVNALSEIIDGGLYHLAHDNRIRGWLDTVSARETEQYRLRLAAKDELRRAVLKALDDQTLDVLTYPTFRRKAAALGEAQYGSKCRVSAHTGYPAITMPAGFTADGLPVGLELSGRPLTDDRLVAIAYAFEHVTHSRRAPYSTPPLVGGQAPEPVTLQGEARGSNGEGVTGQFTFDIITSALSYSLSVEGGRSEAMHAVTLDLIREDRKGPVIYLLAPAGSTSGAGTITLSKVARQALQDGNLAIVLYTRDHASGLIGSRLTLP